jgi:carboxyl-terminal processing protease
MDSTTINKNNEWLKNLKKDIYLAETINIMNDMMRSTAKVDMSTGMK